jgi:hypothetical protein
MGAVTTSNAMAAASVQPRFTELGNVTIVCTQAIASDASQGNGYKLFNVASGMTIADVYMRLTTAASTATSVFHLGIATNSSDFIQSYAMNVVTIGRATVGLPYTCTADTPIYAWTGGGAATAASSLVVVATVINTESKD